jgi:hypothetical protein
MRSQRRCSVVTTAIKPPANTSVVRLSGRSYEINWPLALERWQIQTQDPL